MTRVIRYLPRRTGVALALAGAVGASALSGCGVAGNQLHGGVAADVDGTTISSTRVDELTSGYCSYLASPEVRASSAQQGASVKLPRAFWKGQVLGLLVQETVMTDLLAENGLPEPAGLDAQSESYRSQTYPTATSGAAKRATAQISRAVTLLNLAAAELDQKLADPASGDPTSTASPSASQQAFVAWLGNHDVVLNPRYGISIHDGKITYSDGTTSLAVSGIARDGAAETFNTISASGSPDADLQARLNKLPAGQLCG